MSQYVDSLGNPIEVGDIVIYTAMSYRSAVQRTSVVEKIIPFVESPGQWRGRGEIPWVREDQLGKSQPTEYYPRRDEKGQVLPETAYVAQVRALSPTPVWGLFRRTNARLQIRCPGEMTVVTSLVKGIDG